MCDDGVSTFLNVRSRLFGIAYRMLGSVAEAEDVVQDVWLRWQTTDRTVVRDAAAFLATTATRLAINVSQSARARREIGVAPGQPEPLDTRNDPRSAAEREQALASGVWILLERLTPTERAAYILREAFDYAYRDIGSVLRVAESNARQVVSRARQHLVSGRTTVASPAEHRRLFDAFITAAHDGDIGALEHVLESGRGNSRSECADPGQ
jgi:RNA polymerase sigma-70 factor (ECF subfamily)